MKKPAFDENWNVIHEDLNMDDWQDPPPPMTSNWVMPDLPRQESSRQDYRFVENEFQRQGSSQGDYRCTKCHSDNTQSFEVAYHGGTFENSFSGSGYSYEAGRVNVSGTSRQQSDIAAYTSPPKRPRPYLPAIILTFAVPFLFGVQIIVAYLRSPIKFVIYSSIAFGVIVAAYLVCGMIFSPKQWARYHHQFSQWQHSWICLRCGHTFYLH